MGDAPKIEIRNINPHYGSDDVFIGQSLEDCVEQLQAAIRGCGDEFADVVVHDDDYEILT